MDFLMLQRKELLSNFIIYNLRSLDSQNFNVKPQFIIKYNNQFIKASTLCKFNPENFYTFSLEKNKIKNIHIDKTLISDRFKTYDAYNLIESSHVNNTCFKEHFLNYIEKLDFEIDNQINNYFLYDVEFLESNIKFDILKISETDNFDIVSIVFTN